MKETTKKIVQKVVLAIMVVAAVVVGVACWVGGLATRKRKVASGAEE